MFRLIFNWVSFTLESITNYAVVHFHVHCQGFSDCAKGAGSRDSSLAPDDSISNQDCRSISRSSTPSSSSTNSSVSSPSSKPSSFSPLSTAYCSCMTNLPPEMFIEIASNLSLKDKVAFWGTNSAFFNEYGYDYFKHLLRYDILSPLTWSLYTTYLSISGAIALRLLPLFMLTKESKAVQSLRITFGHTAQEYKMADVEVLLNSLKVFYKMGKSRYFQNITLDSLPPIPINVLKDLVQVLPAINLEFPDPLTLLELDSAYYPNNVTLPFSKLSLVLDENSSKCKDFFDWITKKSRSLQEVTLYQRTQTPLNPTVYGSFQFYSLMSLEIDALCIDISCFHSLLHATPKLQILEVYGTLENMTEFRKDNGGEPIKLPDLFSLTGSLQFISLFLSSEYIVTDSLYSIDVAAPPSPPFITYPVRPNEMDRLLTLMEKVKSLRSLTIRFPAKEDDLLPFYRPETFTQQSLKYIYLRYNHEEEEEEEALEEEIWSTLGAWPDIFPHIQSLNLTAKCSALHGIAQRLVKHNGDVSIPFVDAGPNSLREITGKKYLRNEIWRYGMLEKAMLDPDMDH